MKEIIEKLKIDIEIYQGHGPIPFYMEVSEAQTLVTAFEQLTALKKMYEGQVQDLNTIISTEYITGEQRLVIKTEIAKLQSVIQDLSKVLG